MRTGGIKNTGIGIKTLVNADYSNEDLPILKLLISMPSIIKKFSVF